MAIRKANYRCLFTAPLCMLCFYKNQFIIDTHTAACQRLGTEYGIFKIIGSTVIEEGVFVPVFKISLWNEA